MLAIKYSYKEQIEDSEKLNYLCRDFNGTLNLLFPLTLREITALSFWVLGRKRQELADYLNIKIRSTERYQDRIREKCNCDTYQDLVMLLAENRLINLLYEFYKLCKNPGG